MYGLLKIISIVLIIILFSGCIPIGETLSSTVPSVKESIESYADVDSEDSGEAGITEPEPLALDDDLELGVLKVNMTRQQVDEVMKATLSVSKEENTYGIRSEYLTYNDGTNIHLVEGKIYSITTVSSDYPTPRGLKVGDTVKELKKLYGEPSYISNEAIWVYSSKSGYDLFFVTIKEDTIESLKVSQVM